MEESVPICFCQQAGANIVSSNMAGSNSGVNAMVEGLKQIENTCEEMEKHWKGPWEHLRFSRVKVKVQDVMMRDLI